MRQMRPIGRQCAVLGGLAAIFVLTLAGPAGAAPGGSIELGFLNATYTDLDSGLAPVEQGPLTITLSSPTHRLTVHRNRLTLRPDGAGRFTVDVEVEIDGEGRLIADVSGVGVSNRFADDVTARRQVVRATGIVTATRSDDGYHFTVAAPSPAVPVRIESAVVGQIAGACRALSVIPFVSVGCDGLEAALSVVRIPVPEPGTQYFLDRDVTEPDVRRFLDDLLPRR